MKKHTFLFDFVTAFAVAAIISACDKDSGNEPQLPTEGLIAHYSFDGNANNLAENAPPNSNGFTSGVAFISDRKGQQGKKAIRFNGVDSYVEIAHHEAFNFGKNSDFSISFWVKPTAVQIHEASDGPGENGNTIIAKWPNNADIGHPFRFRFYNQKSPFPGEIVNSRWSGICRDNAFASSGGMVTTDGNFHHIVFIKEGNQISLYQNNSLRSNRDDISLSSACDTQNDAPILIGIRAKNGLDAFLGDIDDLRIYNRALSKEEIELLYGE